MKLTRSIDGSMRGNLVIKVRVDANALAAYFITTHQSEDNDDILMLARTKKKAEIIEDARKAVLQHGEERPFYIVGDGDLGDLLGEVTVIFRKRFRGLA